MVESKIRVSAIKSKSKRKSTHSNTVPMIWVFYDWNVSVEIKQISVPFMCMVSKNLTKAKLAFAFAIDFVIRVCMP